MHHNTTFFLYIKTQLNNTTTQSTTQMSPAATLNIPLLPETKFLHTEKRASVSGAVFNVSTSIIGAGIMSIPATLKVLGVFPALAMIIVIAWLTEVSVEFLVRFTSAGESTTYAGVMHEAFGRVGGVSVQIAVMMANFGCVVVFLIIIGDVLSGSHPEGSLEHMGILEQWFGGHWWNARAFALLVVAVFVLFPLVLVRHVELLKFSSAASVLLAMVFVGICSAMAISALFEGKTQSPKMVPSINSRASFFELFTAVPVIATAFTFHFNVHPISNELSKPSDMMRAVRISLVLCSAIYFSVGLFGYLLFGDSLMSDILVNFDRNSGSAMGLLLNDIVRLSYALHLVPVFPLLNYSLRANIDELLFPTRKPLIKDTTRFVCLTVVLLALTYVAAIAIPDIWFFFQFIGSTAAVSLAFVFPGAIVLRDVYGISTTRDRIMAAVMMILAVGTSTIAITSNILDLTGNT